MNKIIESLKSLGFNSYEAKVYVALLKKYPATGYEVSKLADIPQSRTYDTLKALTQKQIVIASSDKPVTYAPIKPTELTKQFKRKMTSNIEYLEKNLPVVKDSFMEPILPLSGVDKIKDKIIDLIKSAKKEIYLEIWSQDYKLFEKELLAAYNRNVEIRIVGYDNLQSNFGLVFLHPYAKKLESHFNGRVLIMTIDSSEMIYAKFQANVDGDATGLWSKNSDIVYLIKELMIHDMLLLDIQHSMTEELMYRYGKGFKRLYEKILSVDSIYRQ